MTAKEYRKRRMANKLAKEARISVSAAFKCIDAVNKSCAAVGPLNMRQREKVLRAVRILLEPDEL